MVPGPPGIFTGNSPAGEERDDFILELQKSDIEISSLHLFKAIFQIILTSLQAKIYDYYIVVCTIHNME